MKYIVLGPTTGGYSHSQPYFIPGSYYFIGFHITYSYIGSSAICLWSKVVEWPNSNLILKGLKGFISDNGVFYGRRRTVETHAFQIIRKTWQSWIKFKAKVTRSFFAFSLHVQTSYGISLILRQLLPFMFEKAMCRIVNHHQVLCGSIPVERFIKRWTKSISWKII